MPLAKKRHGTADTGARRSLLLGGPPPPPPPPPPLRFFNSANTKAEGLRIDDMSTVNFSKIFRASVWSISLKAAMHVWSSCSCAATASIWPWNCLATADPDCRSPLPPPPPPRSFFASAVTKAEGLRTSSPTWSRMSIACSCGSSPSIRTAVASRFRWWQRSRMWSSSGSPPPPPPLPPGPVPRPPAAPPFPAPEAPQQLPQALS
mmetsp:Transcript_24058/g.69592  ORF Transcript_24058/g.69592 Transcript_24058/m.69592 type:complete len:205 (+) Transcript_24058:145-759(+)